MPEIVVSSEDLTVFGGPATVNVEVDFGPTGDRGSQIFANTGKPVIGGNGLTALAPDCQLFDLYINILASDDEYQYVYQLQNVLGTINDLNQGKGKVITVVGCGGNRDKGKRPQMAAIAAKESNKVILTSDNPRDEEPATILAEMEAGSVPIKELGS